MKIFHTYSGEKVKIRFLVSREVGGTITSFSLTNYNSHLILSLDFKLLLLWSNTGEMECLIIALNIYLLIYKLCINLKNIYSFLLHTKVGKCTWLLMACIFFLEFFCGSLFWVWVPYLCIASISRGKREEHFCGHDPGVYAAGEKTPFLPSQGVETVSDGDSLIF